jgi:DNA-binding NtrC family response regulator
MVTFLKILFIETDRSFSALLEKPLRDQGFNLCATIGPDTHIQDLDPLCPDLAILGPSLDKGSGLKCIRKLKIVNPLMPVLVPSEHGTVQEQNSMAYLEGVHYYSQSADVDEISKTIETALAHERNYRLRFDVPVLVGSSPQMSAIRQRIYRVSDKDITVLVTGETGTGKELIARYIHHFSHRSHGPLVKINCGTLPDELMESEVLGFQKGAFTDAHRTKMGRLEMADGGTLFIDEIGDLSPSVQVKFLPILEDKEFSRLGGDRDRPVDVRLIAATNSNLWEKAREGKFRKDLFYRLNVVHILAPPLRDRRGDIPLLVRYFLNKYCLALKKEVPEVPQKALDLFLGYHWPGNVRELENLIRRA